MTSLNTSGARYALLRALFASLVPVVLILAAGCEQTSSGEASRDRKGASGPAPRDGKLHVVCTTGQVADIARRVGGEHIEVTAIMGPGVDPHTYQATPRDIDVFNRADVIFYNGLHLEGRLADRLVDLAGVCPTFAVTKKLREASSDLLREPDEFEGHYDPHVWFDPRIWAHCVEFVGAQLAELDPTHADDYRANADAYRAELLAAHERWSKELASIPAGQRMLVTAHDAFGYFGAAYDIEVRGLQGISTADETDLATVNELVDLLVERNVKAVFVESSVADRGVKSLVEGCRARGHKVSVGGELFSDAMGAEGTTTGTYLGMMDHNVRTIAESLK
ncbi:MAG: manganese transporter [Planctomycetota bacterium]|nr:MAG: manganese transporter [Planctomycetota bacterium]REJ96028.1 MAG: manganese transporter [Planctomycetota bacterium]REK25478.1 MAG: manganese transporter [Planctomycetota bacterium]REK40488.1 MAG: manganese transporter [Planctomycetota bacterium]